MRAKMTSGPPVFGVRSSVFDLTPVRIAQPCVMIDDESNSAIVCLQVSANADCIVMVLSRWDARMAPRRFTPPERFGLHSVQDVIRSDSERVLSIAGAKWTRLGEGIVHRMSSSLP